METRKTTIDLENYRVIGSDGTIAKVFTGRDRGKYVREKSEIDLLELKYDIIEIIIPDKVYSINPSFFEELFINVIIKLGKEHFLKKFEFKVLGEYNYQKPLLEAISRVLRKNSVLG